MFSILTSVLAGSPPMLFLRCRSCVLPFRYASIRGFSPNDTKSGRLAAGSGSFSSWQERTASLQQDRTPAIGFEYKVLETLLSAEEIMRGFKFVVVGCRELNGLHLFLSVGDSGFERYSVRSHKYSFEENLRVQGNTQVGPWREQGRF